VTRTVLILGAGFSRAVSARSPLTDELGNLVLANLGERRRRPFGSGSFETWLSRLAVDQPDLTTAENQQNRALYTLDSSSRRNTREE
jgi:hypothetical protein